MADPVRRGGRCTLPDGARMTWDPLAEVVAGDAGGRAASATATSRGPSCSRSTPQAGRPGSSSAPSDGLLTLHPVRGESELHGNVVTPAGIRHLRFDWSPAARAGRRRLPGPAPGRRPKAGGRHPGRGDRRAPRDRRRQRPALPRAHAPLRATRRAPLARGGGGERDRRGDRRGRRAGRPGCRAGLAARSVTPHRPDATDVDSRCGCVVDEIWPPGANSPKFVDKPVAMASGAPVS